MANRPEIVGPLDLVYHVVVLEGIEFIKIAFRGKFELKSGPTSPNFRFIYNIYMQMFSKYALDMK